MMLDFRQKIFLMLMYMRPVLIISGLGTLSASGTLIMVGVDTMKDVALSLVILKLLILAISVLLFTLMSSKDRKFFYINVGVSTRKLTRMAVILDLAVFFVLLTLIFVLRYAFN